MLIPIPLEHALIVAYRLKVPDSLIFGPVEEYCKRKIGALKKARDSVEEIHLWANSVKSENDNSIVWISVKKKKTHTHTNFLVLRQYLFEFSSTAGAWTLVMGRAGKGGRPWFDRSSFPFRSYHPPRFTILFPSLPLKTCTQASAEEIYKPFD